MYVFGKRLNKCIVCKILDGVFNICIIFFKENFYWYFWKNLIYVILKYCVVFFSGRLIWWIEILNKLYIKDGMGIGNNGILDCGYILK